MYYLCVIPTSIPLAKMYLKKKTIQVIVLRRFTYLISSFYFYLIFAAVPFKFNPGFNQ